MKKLADLGRPRSESSRQAILNAAFRVLVEHGYNGFALDKVATVAHAGRTTIYRWWRSKGDLAVDALFHATEAELHFPNTGSAENDFRGQILELSRLLQGSRGKAMATMLLASINDPALGQALRERWLEPRRRWGFERMQRAYAESEVKLGVEIHAALAALYSPLYAPLLFGGETPKRTEIESILNLVCEAIFKR